MPQLAFSHNSTLSFIRSFTHTRKTLIRKFLISEAHTLAISWPCFNLVHVFYKYVLALEIFVDDSARVEVSDSISRLSRDLNDLQPEKNSYLRCYDKYRAIQYTLLFFYSGLVMFSRP